MPNVTVKVGDLLESKAQTLVNTVNCVGVMGKGIALQFRERFPDMFKDYVARCKRGEVRLGEPYLYRRLIGPWVLNFPTKNHWREVSKLWAIAEGLEYLAAHCREWGIKSLAVPPLGCGNGQLDWSVVGPTLYRGLSALDIPVELYAPHGAPSAQLTSEFLAKTRGRAVVGKDAAATALLGAPAVALVGILSRIAKEPFHWPVGRVTFQKIAYFATQAGIPTGLSFERGSFGPFSPQVKPLVSKLVNHGLVVEESRGRMFVVRPGPTYQDARALHKDSLRAWAPVIEHVADLFLRFPKTADAETAATVHFVAKELEAKDGVPPSESAVLGEVRAWKRDRLPEIEVARAIRSLNLLGWVKLRFSPELLPEDDPAFLA